MEIAPGVTDADWNRLRDKLCPDNIDETISENGASIKLWDKAVHIFKSRIETRYIKPVDLLIDIHRQQKQVAATDMNIEKDRIRPGFAILTLDFIIIETIQGFKSGILDHTGNSQELIKNFLLDSSEFPEIYKEGFAVFIYKAFRCQLTHKGQTNGDFLVSDSGASSINKHSYDSTTINRNKFHEAVCGAFTRYCSELLENTDNGRTLRRNFLVKFDSICKR